MSWADYINWHEKIWPQWIFSCAFSTLLCEDDHSAFHQRYTSMIGMIEHTQCLAKKILSVSKDCCCYCCCCLMMITFFEETISYSLTFYPYYSLPFTRIKIFWPHLLFLFILPQLAGINGIKRCQINVNRYGSDVWSRYISDVTLRIQYVYCQLFRVKGVKGVPVTIDSSPAFYLNGPGAN